MKETVNVRVLKSSWKRLKIIAAKEGITLIQLLEQLSKKV